MEAKVPAAVIDLFQGWAREPLLPTWNVQGFPWEIEMRQLRFITIDGTHLCILLKDSTFEQASWGRLAGFAGLLMSYLAKSSYIKVTGLKIAQAPGNKKCFWLIGGIQCVRDVMFSSQALVNNCFLFLWQ